ncbi:hypothetical protein BMYO_0808 [Bifidobacterium myosotis]|uniref:Uncharacterized protein n=1 Tax=Bifidobacterium myosotis TaxID=1630166 RepID=A0A261FMH1_9BIFI|nr:hypothetical protein BMYO_0808 [Bifidobacterium myosotis]
MRRESRLTCLDAIKLKIDESSVPGIVRSHDMQSWCPTPRAGRGRSVGDGTKTYGLYG